MTVLQRKASMQQNAFLLVPAIKGDMYITHCNYSQPASIKLDNKNIGGHCYTFTECLSKFGPVQSADCV